MNRDRATQGVKLIRVDEGDEIAAITKLDEKEEELEETIAAKTIDENVVDETSTDDTDDNETSAEENNQVEE